MNYDHGQSVKAWAGAQKELTAEDRDVLATLPGVRTMNDLQTVLTQGEVPKELAAKLNRILKN